MRIRFPRFCYTLLGTLPFTFAADINQSKVADGTIPSRRLLGGARFLPADVEEYLRNSAETPPR
jgi:hypothetical protein